MGVQNYLDKAVTKARVIRYIATNLQNPHDYFLDCLHLKKGVYTIRLMNGIRLDLRAASIDRNFFNEVYIHDIYCPAGFEVKENDIVVDIGAHIGLFTIYAADAAKKGKVYSFEPFEENFSRLQRNVAQNGKRNAFVEKIAISKNAGDRKLFVSDNNTGGHSFYSLNDAKSKYDNKLTESSDNVIVKTISLPEVLKKHRIPRIDLLKLDCEGEEYEILFNCPDEVIRKIKRIVMEAHTVGDNDSLTMKSFLEKKGFLVSLNKNDSRLLYAMNKSA